MELNRSESIKELLSIKISTGRRHTKHALDIGLRGSQVKDEDSNSRELSCDNKLVAWGSD